MKRYQVDVAIIGAGTAGLTAYRAAKKAGAKTLLIEAGPYGTTCARVGCMPSKLLIAAAEAAHQVADAPTFGINPGEVRIDARAVMERVRRERDRFVGFVVEGTEQIAEGDRLRGYARFQTPTVLEVEQKGGAKVEVVAKSVVIATGSRSWIPPELEALKEEIMDNADIFEMEDLPASMAVIGPGVIGLELGQALDRLGVEVDFFSPFSQIGPVFDPAVGARVREVFEERLTMHLELKSYSVEKVDAGFEISWVDKEGEQQRKIFEKILSTAGRVPNVDNLGLENAGIECNTKGVPNHDARTTQCGNRPIFVAGDASHRHPLLHEAADEGRIAGKNAANYPEVRAHLRKVPLAIVFSDPQIAVIGGGWRERDQEAICVGEVDYRRQGRARVMNRHEGLVRIYADKNRGCLLGAEMFGPAVEHMAHLLAWAIEARLSVYDALSMPFYHPVVEEGLRTALKDLAAKLKLAAPVKSEELRYGPGT